jgi:hypothetical protein
VSYECETYAHQGCAVQVSETTAILKKNHAGTKKDFIIEMPKDNREFDLAHPIGRQGVEVKKSAGDRNRRPVLTSETTKRKRLC